MGCSDLKNIKISDWSIEKDSFSDNKEDLVLNRNIIFSNGRESKPCCTISSRPNLFSHLPMINNYYLEIYIGKAKKINSEESTSESYTRSYNPDKFRSFKTLFEAILYADLYLRDIGILKLKSISYKKEWEDLL